MNKGRPPKIEPNNFNFSDLAGYFLENQKDETEFANTTNDDTNLNSEYNHNTNYEAEKNQETQQDNTEYELVEETMEETNEESDIIDLEGFIKIDANSIQMADVVLSSALESVFNFFGWEKEVQIMTRQEAKFFEKNLPSLRLKRNWKNIGLIYLFTKLK